MATSITINGQEYIIEEGIGGYSYYRLASKQRFGKKVKTKNGSLLVFNGSDGTPNENIGINALTWGNGSTYVEPLPYIDWSISDISLFSLSQTSSTLDEPKPKSLRFADEGSMLYVTGRGSDNDTETVWEYSLSTPYDMGTMSLVSSLDIDPQMGSYNNPSGIWISDDGTRFWIIQNLNIAGDEGIFEYSMSTPFTLSTASFVSEGYNVSGGYSNPSGLFFDRLGTKMFSAFSGDLLRFDLSTAFDISTASISQVETWPLNDDKGIMFNPSGTQLLLVEENPGTIKLHNLSTPWDISTAVEHSTLDVTGIFGYSWNSIDVSHDGQKVFLMNFSQRKIYKFELP